MHVIQSHPGAWEIGQMPANAPARAFWLRVVSRLTAGQFSEVHVTEGWWHGTVQRFRHEGPLER
jgi:predicted acetyltransferase